MGWYGSSRAGSAVAVLAVTVFGTAVLAWSAAARTSAPAGAGWRGTGGATAPISSCPAASSSGTQVVFTARDMGMGSTMMGGAVMGPMVFTPRFATAPTGRITVTLFNAGSRPHELLVFPLAAGEPAGWRSIRSGGRVSETDSLGEVEPVCPKDASVDGTPAGGLSQVTMTLAPGRYEIVCNLPGHYGRGMFATLIVN